eukprot:CAMPEP_0195155098 /NCGR_PEP_ID=MMETSP0448-20130528/183983_1 /TAXON_ID=66468 /ORGANISM="Heterocapsa triquestra, Strain CCMP 448" /LENGTH=181 /DNA_ID=CAMNT_0040193881 /DNA_START=937 /DNA_END=1483 /DNA_ORIENTATION=-
MHTGSAEVVHALCHVLVFAEVVRRVALRVPVCPVLDRRKGEDLQCAVDHVPNVAVDHVHLLPEVRAHVPAEPVGEEDRVRVHLGDEGVHLPLAAGDEHVPGIDEQPGVACGPINRGHDRRSLEADRLFSSHRGVAIGGQQGVTVATPDSHPLCLLRGHQAHLVADVRITEKQKSDGDPLVV